MYDEEKENPFKLGLEELDDDWRDWDESNYYWWKGDEENKSVLEIEETILEPIEQRLEETVRKKLFSPMRVLTEEFRKIQSLPKKLAALKLLYFSSLTSYLSSESIAKALYDEAEKMMKGDSDSAKKQAEEYLQIAGTNDDPYTRLEDYYYEILEFCSGEIVKCELELFQSLGREAGTQTQSTDYVPKIQLSENVSIADMERIFAAMQQAGIIERNPSGEQFAKVFFREKKTPLQIANSYKKAKSEHKNSHSNSDNSELFARLIEALKPHAKR